MARDSWVTVRLDERERAALASLARGEGRSLAGMARRLMAPALSAVADLREGKPSSTHVFTPKPGNTLKCAECGARKADHR